MSPIALVQSIAARDKTPVSRSPERPDIGSGGPYSWNPIVAGWGIRPVAGRPDVVWLGTWRLLIFRQRRRSLGSVFGDRILVVLIKALISRRSGPDRAEPDLAAADIAAVALAADTAARSHWEPRSPVEQELKAERSLEPDSHRRELLPLSLTGARFPFAAAAST